MSSLLRTTDQLHPLVIRVILGIVMLPHGLQKVFGWFGGQGISGTLSGFEEHMGIPVALGALVIAAESLGSLGLIVGLLTRVAALGIACVMIGAIVTVHLPNGFFMNWSGQQAGEGFEYHLLALGMALSLMLSGAGRFSLDRRISNRSSS